jgi:hypothetical protein
MGKAISKLYLQIGCFLTLSVNTDKGHSIGVVLTIQRVLERLMCGCAEKNVMAYDNLLDLVVSIFFSLVILSEVAVK